MDRRQVYRGTRQEGLAALTGVDLRSPPRLVAQAAGRAVHELRPARRAVDPLCQGYGVHPSRAAADFGAPVRSELGLPADRALLADRTLRRASGVQAFRRRGAQGWAWHYPRLGAGALPDRRARSR